MNRAIALAAVCITASACQGGKNPLERTGGPQLTMPADRVVLDVGTSTSLAATVRNISERAWFVARHPGVATVSAGGAISGIAVGSMYVVTTPSDRPAASSALFFQIGLFDTAVHPVDAQASYHVASDAKRVRYHEAGHGLNSPVLVDRQSWLQQRIGIDPGPPLP